MLVYFDNDIVECQFRCSNGRFAGWADVYLEHDELDRFATSLRGFPIRNTDFRDFELGTFNPAHADGGIRLHFYCTDGAGHSSVEVRLRGDGCASLGEPESVALRIPIEAAGLDSFVLQLGGMKLNLGARAYLPMTGLNA